MLDGQMLALYLFPLFYLYLFFLLLLILYNPLYAGANLHPPHPENYSKKIIYPVHVGTPYGLGLLIKTPTIGKPIDKSFLF